MEQIETLIDHPHRFEHMVSQMLDTAASLGATYGLRTVGALVILIVGWSVARLVQRALLRIGHRSQRVDLTVASFLGGLAKYLIIAFTIVAMLASIGVETTSVVAVLGAAGIAIGLALQGTLSQVAAGFMLILFRPFRVDDAVETAGVAGTVTEVSLFTTEIRTGDNIRVIIPNNAVWSGVTKNHSSYRTRRTELEVVIPYGADIAVAVKIVTAAVEADKRVLKDPAPVVGVAKFTDANVRLVMQVWSLTTDADGVRLDLNLAIRDELAKAGTYKA
jgi:small conductance mechanosensitive channel